MTRYIAVTLLFFLITGLAYSADLPVDDLGRFSIRPDMEGGSALWGNFIPAIRKQYEERFGAHPALMIWSDVDEKKMLAYSIQFFRPGDARFVHDWTEPEWLGDSLHWSDISDHFQWCLTSVKSGQTIRKKVTEVEGDPLLEETWTAPTIGSWKIDLYFDGRSLPVPEDGSAWNLTMEVYKSVPPIGDPWYVTPDTLAVVRAQRTTPLDTLEWASHNNLVLRDKELDHRLLAYFPHNRELLTTLFFIYSEEENCDSLKSISQQLWNTLENRLDPFYAEPLFGGDDRNGPLPMNDLQRQQIQNHLMNVCGDTLDW